MAVLGRLSLGSAERLDLPDLLAIDSYAAADFKYLIQTFIGGDKPFVLKGFDVIQPQDSIGTENISIRVAESVVYYPGSKAGSFYYGLPEGSTNTEALIPELRKNATNFVYLTFNTFDTAQDSRAFWDPDQNGGAGGEFSQDVNTESVLSVEVGVSVSTFPDNTIPVCKVTVGSSVIESIQDCRDMMFRLGSGGVTPDPFNTYSFRNDPSASYARSEPATTMTSALDANPFQGGDKNIYSLKEWMDVVMTKLKEISGTTYWYENAGSSGGTPVSVNNIFTDALGSTLKSKGQWQHSNSVAGQATWTEDIHYLSLRDSRDLILRANTITLDNEEVAWIEIIRDAEINNSSQAVSWLNSSTTVNGITGAFVNLAKGDWIKKKPDSPDKFLRVEEFYALPNLAGGTTTPALAQSIRLSGNYAGTTGSEIGEYTKGEYLLTDVQITAKTDAPVQVAGGNFYWIAYRSDTSLSLAGIVPTQLTINITEADGQRARVTSTVAHGLVDGDRVEITTGPYAGTYKIEAADTDDFYIETAITGDSIAQTAFYAIVTTAARSTPYSYSLETANHGFKSDEYVTLQNTSSLYDGSYLINVRSATTFQIPIGSLIVNPGAISGEIVSLPRMNVRTEFGTVKIVQGEDVNIGDADSQNILTYVGMDSLAQQTPNYYVPSSSNMLRGHQNYNSDPADNLTVRASRLTAMMADRIQDRGMQIIGRTNIVNVTSGANQEISSLANLTLKKPGSSDLTISLTTPVAIPANSIALIDIDRDGSGSITPTVESWGSNYVISENKIILFYRFADTTVYTWNGAAIAPSGHLNLHAPEDSQNRNVWVFNPGSVYLDISTDQLVLDVQEIAEVTQITTLAAASVPSSSYFTFNAAYDTTEYYVWYNKDGSGVDPAIVGKTGIPVIITTGDTATQVATATMTAINIAAGSDVTATTLVDVLTITNDAIGPATDAEDGTSGTGFTFDVVTQGVDPDIQVVIPGSANNGVIDVDVINTLGTLALADGQSAWIRINRFAAKTYNTVSFTNTPDTDGAGAIYVSNTADIPIDQDVFVLWSRNGNNVLETHHGRHPDGNVYDEVYTIISGIPSNAYEIPGPIPAGTELLLPADSRDGGSNQEYIVGSGQLELFLNGQYLRVGEDWSEVGQSGSLSRRISIDQDLEIGDYLTFRIDAKGAVYFAAGSGGGGSLQDAYDGGRFINVTAGLPVVITGASGKLLSVQGDMDVTGVIDPAGITFSQEASDPLGVSDYGIWRNALDQFVIKHGANPAINLSTTFLRADGSIPLSADLDADGFAVKNLAAPVDPDDAVKKSYVDDINTAIENDFLRLDGTNPMQADLDFDSNKAINVANPVNPQDAATKDYVDSGFLKLDGTNPMEADLNLDGNQLINVGEPVNPQDAATKNYVDTAGKDKVLTSYLNSTGSTIPAGTVVYKLTTGNQIAPADASSPSTSLATVGVVESDILDGASGFVQVAGKVTVLGSLTAGNVAYLSTTTGQATTAAPSTTGDTLIKLGVAVSATQIELSVQFDRTIDNPYDETYDIVSGAPSNDYELTGPILAGNNVELPLDSRNSSLARSYRVGEGVLQVYLNGARLRVGDDWSEVGTLGDLSTEIEINIDLEIGDDLSFVIPLIGETVVNSGGGGGGEANTASNVGAGAQVFKQKSGVDLQFRSIETISGVAATQGTNTISLQAKLNVRSISTSDTALNTDDLILVDSSGGVVTISLPSAVGISGKVYHVKKTDASGNNVTIEPDGAELIDGLSNKSTNIQYETLSFVSDGSQWWLI